MDEQNDYQLQLKDIHLSFGGIKALHGVSTGVKKGEIFSIIGPNGAGKTCLLNCINRFYQPDEGQIVFEGRDITHLKPHRIPRLGIARTFQNVELFGHMNVLDNIKLGAHVHLKSGAFSGGVYYGKTRAEEMALRRDIEERIIDLSGNRAHSEARGTYPPLRTSKAGGDGTGTGHAPPGPPPG